MEHQRVSGTLDKALDVLHHLHTLRSPRGVTEVGRALSLPKSTTHRLLSALARRGFVERTAEGLYRPGMALVALGLGALEGEPVVAAARPILEAEAEAVGETLFVAAARGGRILVLDKREGSGFLRASPRVGAELPAHATAIGKLYLALAPGELASPAGNLAAYTASTLTRPQALELELSLCAERGWSENREEWIPGLMGIAAPIRRAGRLEAALAISFPSARLDARDRDVLASRVVRAARRVEERLEGRAT